MSLSSEKLYEKPGSQREQDITREQEKHATIEGNHDKTVIKRTKAKNSKGKTVALTLLLAGTLVAGTIFGTKAVHCIRETNRVNNLISEYQTDDYVILPRTITSDRAYDITYADGKTVTKELEDENINCININGQFYTPDGNPVAILTYEVNYISQVDAIKVTNEGQTMYMAPNGYSLSGKCAYKVDTKVITKIVPVSTDYSFVTFPGASSWNMISEPMVVATLPYECITNSTLICDVPDGAVLNDNNECIATLDLAPKKR